MIADYGIFLEIIGFVLIALVGLPGYFLMGLQETNSFLARYFLKIKFPKKLEMLLRDTNIPLVVFGLILQHSEINSWFFNNFPEI